MQGRNAHVVPMAQRFIALLTERVLPFFSMIVRLRTAMDE
jgi:hypothetical protein